MNKVRIGIDLGGTKTEIVALNVEGREILRERRPTPAHSYSAILQNLSELVFSAEKQIGQTCSVGIGVPGAISPASGLIKNANTVCLIGQPLDQDLGRILSRPVRLANDANCFALSEASDGAGAGADVVFGVILGTGVGGGIVVHGRVLSGPNAIAGEWGHNPLPWPKDSERPGPSCYCGKNGCIETFLSGPGLQRDHLLTTGETLAGEQIGVSGERSSEETMARFEHRLARSLASVINVIDPDVIVLGGGLSNLERLYQSVPRLWNEFVFSDRVDTRLVRAKHGDSSGVRGAAWLWPSA